MDSVLFNRLKSLFHSHLASCKKNILTFLEKTGDPGLLLDSGSAEHYFSDDQEVPFRSNPYFKYFCPLEGEKHLVSLANKGELELFVYEPQSFWTDLSYEVESSFWESSFDRIHFLRSDSERKKIIDAKKSWATLSSTPGTFSTYSKVNLESYLNAFNWWRCKKTEYEIFCLDQANKKGASAHKRVKDLFLNENPSELELHYEYLKTLGDTENKLPYSGIIAYDEKAAILHYQYKRNNTDAKVLLIDSGASFLSYGSDITRTYARKQKETSVFAELISAVDLIQQEICEKVEVGANYVDLQIMMHHKLGQLLLDYNLLHSVSPEAAFEQGLTKVFCPHGLGHLLGLQTHDVGGFQVNEAGDKCEKDPRMPHARMNRVLYENEVVTIEPGLYFIPFLLEEKRNTKEGSCFNWNLIETLVPLGGIRIEDNLVVRKGSSINLTRPFLP